MDRQEESIEEEAHGVDEKPPGETQVGPFHLGEECPEVGPDLGRLQLAHHEDGSASLVLTPGKNADMDWQLETPWTVTVSSRQPSTVTLKVEQAPASGRATKLTDLFVLLGAALRRTEDSLKMDRHLTDGSRRLKQQWARRTLLAGLAGFVLCGGLCLWAASRFEQQQGTSALTILSQGAAPSLFGGSGRDPISYPLPEQPFKNQAVPPCQTARGEIEINGGCWGKFSLKPPCDDDMAEYKGECYLPLSKKRSRPARSQEP